MSVSGEIPDLLFQREYNGRWALYSTEESSIINKAFKKSQKTVRIVDNKKKILINFEKMCQKNLDSGFEQRVRCVLYINSSYISWYWKGDHEDWISYTPRTALLLEISKEKGLSHIDFFIKEKYIIDINDLTQKNSESGHIRKIFREVLDIASAPNIYKLMVATFPIQKFIKSMATEDYIRIKSFILNLPLSPPQSTHAVASTSSAPDSILEALTAEMESEDTIEQEVTVDQECPNAHIYKVYFEEDYYTATLNLANVIENNNKFFIIQLLKEKKKKAYSVFFHWGRVGYKGQTNIISCGNQLEKAKSVFEKKFFDKTGNVWEDRNNFRKLPNKYELVFLELTREVPLIHSSCETKLDMRVQILLSMICNKKNLEEAANEMCFDCKSLPLGKIKPKQILEGYTALNMIADILKEDRSMSTRLIDACNNFYTKIPHDFGRKQPTLISTMTQVKEKLKMLEDLTQISLAMDLMSTGTEGSHIIDVYYRRLECELQPIEHSSDHFRALEKVLKDTHGPTHSSYYMEILEAFTCNKDVPYSNLDNKKLLWHGSRISNWIGILKNGLQIAPPEAPATGYMFGKGIYFADSSSKSANYCYATKKANEGLLLLCEVALGNSITAHEAADYSILPAGYDSVFAVGKIKPQKFEITVLSSEASVPCGPISLIEEDETLTLNYNEYIVYDVKNVKLRYLLRIKFHF